MDEVEYFNQRAKEWDDKPARIERAQAVAEAIRRAVPLSTKLNALEYGCGTGLLSFALQADLGHITLVDTSDGMLDVVRQKIAAAGLTHLTPRRLDLSTEPALSEHVDLIYTLMTLHHIPDVDTVLEKFYASLKPDGWLCIADLDKEDGSFHKDEFHGHHGFDQTELAQKLEHLGFDDISSSTAYQVLREHEGEQRTYPVFLMAAHKSA
jgi:ubiquinone/menaquinone biosynthesis C-methylase UbiE